MLLQMKVKFGYYLQFRSYFRISTKNDTQCFDLKKKEKKYTYASSAFIVTSATLNKYTVFDKRNYINEN